MTRKIKNKSSFSSFFVVFVLINLIVVLGGLRLVWVIAEDYEASMPETYAQELAQQLQNKEYAQILARSGFTLSAFETHEHFTRFMDQHLGTEPTDIKITRTLGQAEGTQKYKLSKDKTLLAEITLQQEAQKSRYGFARWQVDSITGIWQTTKDYAIMAPEGSKIAINGIPLDTAHQSAQKAPVPAYQSMPEGVAPPYVSAYKLAGLLLPPTVTAETPTGQPCTIQQKDTAIVITQPGGDAVDAQAKSLGQQVASLYARFITKDATFTDLSAYLLRGSPFYSQMATFYNGWYIPHDSYSFENMQVDNIVSYSPQHFSCDVSFNYYITKGSKRHAYPSAYTIYFVQHGGRWQVANLVIQ